RIVGSHVPKMALRIAAAEAAASVIFVLDVDHDFETGGLGPGIDGIGVRDYEVRRLGFLAADFIRLANVPAVLIICNRAEHHHPLPKLSCACAIEPSAAS